MSVVEPSGTVRQSLPVNLLLASAVALLFLAGLEGLARLFVAPPRANPTADYIWDWEKRWDGEFYNMASSSVGWPPGADEFNRDGLRDRRHAEEPAQARARIAFLGDSVTFGHGIEADEAYPQRLQAALDRAGRDAEVFNVGLAGWTARQQRIAYERIVRRYRPDIVVVAICLNDIPEMQNNLTRPAPWLVELHERSALVRGLIDAPGREIANVEELFERPPDARVEEGFASYFDELRSLQELVQEDGAQLGIIVFPFRFQVEAGAPDPVAQERILQFCSAEGLDCLDLLPMIAPLGTSAFVDYDHLSPAGAELVAQTLARWQTFAFIQTPEAQLGSGVEAVSELLAVAREPDGGSRQRAAVWLLGQRDDRAIVDLLGQLLSSAASEATRREAAIQLGLRGEAALPQRDTLLAALADERASVRWAAAESLARLGRFDASVAPALANACGSSDSFVSGFAMWTLGEMGEASSAAVPALAEALRRGDGGGRAGAAAALSKIGEAAVAAVPALLAELAHPRAARRWRAVRTLGRIGPGAIAAVPRLAEALDDEDQGVRVQAARALGRIGPGAQDAIDALVSVLDSDDRELAEAASRALSSIPGR